MNENKNYNGRWISGVIILALGVFLLLNNNFDLFYFDFADYIFTWKTLLIVIGVAILLKDWTKIGGYVLLLIGIAGHYADYLDISLWEILSDYWPVILLIIGVRILFKKDNKPCCQTDHRNMTGSENSDDLLEVTAILNGQKIVSNSQNFRGGKTTTIMGGAEINLTLAKLASGYNVLDTFTLFGGLELMVPKEWNVNIKVTPIFGGVDDKRYIFNETKDPVAPTLEIRGMVMFGGCEIKYY